MVEDPAVKAAEDGAELRVGEVARQLGVSPSTIRSWERRFELPAPDRSAGGHRRYRAADVAQLRAMGELIRRGHPLGRLDGGDGTGAEIEAVLAVTRAALRSTSPAEVRDAVVAFVRMSGGDVVSADEADVAALPFDLSFGEGEPLLPTAEKPSVVRLQLERTLPAVLDDARRIVALLRATSDARSEGPPPG